MRWIALMAMLLLAGCGGGSGGSGATGTLADRLGKDADSQLKASGFEGHGATCAGSGQTFTCTVKIGTGGRATYDVTTCGDTYDARAKAPTPIYHLGGDCRTSQDLPQRAAALAGVRVTDAAGCARWWAKSLARECAGYVAAGSPHKDATVDYVSHRPDGVIEVDLKAPGQRGLVGVTVATSGGRTIVRSTINF
jgi:hypothetical protein